MNKDDTLWLGLASYEEEDEKRFFGRNAQSQGLFGNIAHNTQTIIYGPSGMGKTSIIKAGVFPLARKKNFLPVYIRLDHESSEQYSAQIIRRIEKEMKKWGRGIEERMTPIPETKSSLWEYLHTHLFWSRECFLLVPLLVIDQFEEIFTRVKDKEKSMSFFEDLSNLCNNKIPNDIQDYLNKKEITRDYSDTINYRIVLSLREEYLARLEEQAEKIPALRRNRFSLQAVNDEQAMEIIMKPGEGIVTDDVAREIIKKTTSKDNQIETSILSLFCNELNKKRIEKEKDSITLALVNDFGDNIIADFCDQVMGKVLPETAEYLEEKLLSEDGSIRTSIIKDEALKKVTKDDLTLLENNRLIRSEKRKGAERIELTHDVLCKPLKERLDKARTQNLQKQRRKRQRRRRYLAWGIGASLFIIAGVIGGDRCRAYGYKDNYAKTYLIVTRENGWFIGKNPISKKDAEHCAVYFKLTKRGAWSKHWTKIEALDGYQQPTTDHLLITYMTNPFDNQSKDVNSKLLEKRSTVCTWEMIPDEKKPDFLKEERGLDKNGNVLFTLRRKFVETNTVTVSYDDGKGVPLVGGYGGSQLVKITHTGKDEERWTFFDSYNNSIEPPSGVRSIVKKYQEGLLVSEEFRDENDKPINDDAKYCGWECAYYPNGLLHWLRFVNKDGETIEVKNGRKAYRLEYANEGKYGNIQRHIYLDDINKVNPDESDKGVNSAGIHSYTLTYNERGKIETIECRDKVGALRNNNLEPPYAILATHYDENGNKLWEIYSNQSGEKTLKYEWVWKNGSNLTHGIVSDWRGKDWNKLRKFDPGDTSLSKIQKRGTLKVGVYNDFKPFGYQSGDGGYHGLEPALARRLAKNLLGDEDNVTFVKISSDERSKSLDSGNVDIVLAMFTKTLKRKREVDFAMPYLKTRLAIAVLPSNNDTNISLATLVNSKKIIIVNKETVAADFLTEKYNGFKALLYKDKEELLSALRNGDGDALLHDWLYLLPLAEFKIAAKDIGKAEEIAPAVKRGDEKLLAWLEQQMSELAKEGFFQKIYHDEVESHLLQGTLIEDILSDDAMKAWRPKTQN